MEVWHKAMVHPYTANSFKTRLRESGNPFRSSRQNKTADRQPITDKADAIGGYRRDSVVVRASASQSLDSGSMPLTSRVKNSR